MNNGFIVLSRSLLDSEVFSSQKMLKIWIWCLLKANYKNKFISIDSDNWSKTIEIKRGQFLFGRFKAESELSINGSSIYRLMKKLEEIGNITIKTNNKYSIVTICNYDTYQDIGNYTRTPTEQQVNNKRTTSEQQVNTTKKEKKEKKDNNIKERESLFQKTLLPFYAEYSKETVEEFFNYWSEPNPSKTKMKFELEKTWDLSRRLKTWQKNQLKWDKQKQTGNYYLDKLDSI